MHIVQTKVHHNHLINGIRTKQTLLIETVPVIIITFISYTEYNRNSKKHTEVSYHRTQYKGNNRIQTNTNECST